MDKSSCVPENLAEPALKTAASSPNPYSDYGLPFWPKKIYFAFHADGNAAKRPIKSKRPIKVKPKTCSLFSLQRPINLKLK